MHHLATRGSSEMTRNCVPIGITAIRSEVVPTIDYYEENWPLQAPPRTKSNRRHYDAAGSGSLPSPRGFIISRQLWSDSDGSVRVSADSAASSSRRHDRVAAGPNTRQHWRMWRHRAQRVARKFPLPIGFGEIPAHAGGKCCALDEAHNVLVVEAVGAGLLAVLCQPAEQRSVRDASEVKPGLQRHNRAGVIA